MSDLFNYQIERKMLEKRNNLRGEKHVFILPVNLFQQQWKLPSPMVRKDQNNN